ncbi:MAG TPA: M48 family metalloprotease [Candidatus Hypogeohydataceae bacterium YC38]|nr:M48 family metalloprotease [Candidatus Brocadiales bacterium]
MAKHVTFILLAILLILPCWVFQGNEALGGTIGPRVSQEEVEQAYRELQERKQLYKGQQEEKVKSVGSRLLAQVESPAKIDFQIQEEEAVNAGATFGRIVVTTGMMRFIQSEDELAVVLGHEITHVVKNHIMKGIISNIPLILGSIAAERAAPGSGRMVQLGGSIFTQKFSRDMEREADYYGLLYAHRAGFDVEAGIDIWERFAVELPESQRSSLFSSHPTSTERLARARKVATTLKEKAEVESPVGKLDLRKPTVEVEGPPSQGTPPGGEVVARKNSPVIHRPSCPRLENTTRQELVRFPSREEAIKSGGRPCQVCQP